jgi:uncharacterized protein (DUF2336 family)
MQVESGLLISELETAVGGGDAGKRTEILRRITDLFLQASDHYSDEQTELFDDVMLRLSAKIETTARADLSRRLATLPHAPLGIVRNLAHDDAIDVAGPVLTQSPRIDEKTVLAIARTKSQEHLLAISQRASVNEATTDVLVERGNQEVVRSVASNNGARFSETGAVRLADRAANDGILAVRLLQRTDIKSHQMHAVIAKASQAVLNKMVAECPNLEANIRNVVLQAAGKYEDALDARPRDYASALKQIDMLLASEKLGETAIGEFARTKNIEMTVAALARLCDISVDAVERCLFNEQSDLALILARAAGLSWVSARCLLMLRNAEMPEARCNPEDAKAHFLKLHPVTAQRLLRFYRVRNLTPNTAPQ